MKTQTKIVVSTIVIVLVAIGIWAYIAGHQKLGGTALTQSTTGVTNSTRRIAQIAVSNVASTSVAAILNSDSTDRVISSVDYFMVGGTTGNTFTMATSTDPGNLLGNTNYVFNASIASSSPYLASSTPGSIGASMYYRVWASGTYLDIQSNATSTMNGVFTIEYLSL